MCVRCNVLHASVRGRDESREMVVVLQMLLSLTLTHTHTHTHTQTQDRVSHAYTISRHLSISHAYTVICTLTPLYHTHTVSTLPFRHDTHIDTYTRSLSVTHTESLSKYIIRVHLKPPNPNKHELKLNSNIRKYCSVKNFSSKKNVA